IAGRLIDKKGSKPAVIVGAVLLLTGTGLLLTYQEESGLIWLLFIMSILGISNGFNNIAAQTAVYEHVEEKDTGDASGLCRMCRSLGASLYGSFLGMAFDQYLDMPHFHIVVIVGFVFCILILALTFALPKKQQSKVSQQ